MMDAQGAMPVEEAAAAEATAAAEVAEAVEAIATTEAGETDASHQDDKRKVGVIPIIVIVALVIAVAAAVAVVLPGQSSKLGKDDFDTTTALDKAIEVENLSTAEFVYNGIAEHYREEGEGRNPLLFWESNDPVDYRVCYRATVKARINMSDVHFTVDEAEKTVTAELPEIALACYVDPNGMQFVPEGTDADMQAVFKLCEDDVENEARQSEELRKTAQENLRRTIEALTKPVITAGGYTLNWA